MESTFLIHRGSGRASLWMFIILICFVSVSHSHATEEVQVDSPFGKIIGVKTTDDVTGESYVAFRGIPYAKPPLGELRLAKPEPHPKLDGMFNATKESIISCPHPDVGPLTLDTGDITYTEDCLILNIQMKNLEISDSSSLNLKKVLVFIHGGGFIGGFSGLYVSKSLVLSQDIIIVTMNYRLGVLGFLSTENEASLGNYGIWDQHLALKWVKENIRSFGGDPEDITIAGESAGGISVGFHVLSPYGKGLFTKAYPQSGTTTSATAIHVTNRALIVAKASGCWEKDVDDKPSLAESKAVMKCLRQAPVSAFTSYVDFNLDLAFFAPRVDGDFIPDLPAKLLEDAAYLDSIGFFDRDYLVGLDNSEFQLFDNMVRGMKEFLFAEDDEATMDDKEKSWQEYIDTTTRMLVHGRLGDGGEKNEKAAETVNDFYARRFVGRDRAFVELLSDLGFTLPSYDFVSAVSRRETCNVYFLYFNHFPEFMKGAWRGIAHGVDLAYWFDLDIELIDEVLKAGIVGNMTDEDLELKSLFSSIIGEFIRSGNPGKALEDHFPDGWPKYDDHNSYYLNFNPKPWVSNFLEKDKHDLWFKTLPKMMNKEEKQHNIHSDL